MALHNATDPNQFLSALNEAVDKTRQEKENPPTRRGTRVALRRLNSNTVQTPTKAVSLPSASFESSKASTARASSDFVACALGISSP